MINAKEAFIQAKQIRDNENDKIISEIDKKIRAAITEGKYEIELNIWLKDEIKSILEEKGYAVNRHTDQREGDSTIIKWDLSSSKKTKSNKKMDDDNFCKSHGCDAKTQESCCGCPDYFAFEKKKGYVMYM